MQSHNYLMGFYKLAAQHARKEDNMHVRVWS